MGEVEEFFESFGPLALFALIEKRIASVADDGSYIAFSKRRNYWREKVLMEFYQQIYREQKPTVASIQDTYIFATRQFIRQYNQLYRNACEKMGAQLKGMLRRALTTSTLNELAFELSCLDYFGQCPGSIKPSDLEGSNRYDFEYLGSNFRLGIEAKTIEVFTGSRVDPTTAHRFAEYILPKLQKACGKEGNLMVWVELSGSLEKTDGARSDILQAAIQSYRESRSIKIGLGEVFTKEGPVPKDPIPRGADVKAEYAFGRLELQKLRYTFIEVFGSAPQFPIIQPMIPNGSPRSAMGFSSTASGRHEKRLYETLKKAADQLSSVKNGLVMVELSGIPSDLFLGFKEGNRQGIDSYYRAVATKLFSRYKNILGVVYCSELDATHPITETTDSISVTLAPQATRNSFTVPNQSHRRKQRILTELNLLQ